MSDFLTLEGAQQKRRKTLGQLLLGDAAADAAAANAAAITEAATATAKKAAKYGLFSAYRNQGDDTTSFWDVHVPVSRQAQEKNMGLGRFRFRRPSINMARKAWRKVPGARGLEFMTTALPHFVAGVAKGNPFGILKEAQAQAQGQFSDIKTMVTPPSKSGGDPFAAPTPAIPAGTHQVAYHSDGTPYYLNGPDELGKFSFKRAFTPPRRIRKTLGRAPKNLKKGLRYYGATVATVLTGGFASHKVNKMFGLSAGEQKSFNAAAKISRVAVIATASVLGAEAIYAASVGIGAGLSAAGVAGGGLTAGGSGTAVAGGGLFAAMGQKVKSFLIKDAAGSAVWKVTKDLAGQVIGEKFHKNTIDPADYAALPAGEAVPIGEAQAGGSGTATHGGGYAPDGNEGVQEVSHPATVAGSGGMAPGGVTEGSYVEGESEGVDPAARSINSSDNPLGANSDILAEAPQAGIDPATQAFDAEHLPTGDMAPVPDENAPTAADKMMVTLPQEDAQAAPTASAEEVVAPVPDQMNDDFSLALARVRSNNRESLSMAHSRRARRIARDMDAGVVTPKTTKPVNRKFSLFSIIGA